VVDKPKGLSKRKDNLCGFNCQVAANYLSAKKTRRTASLLGGSAFSLP
jgi:hypothetical protein